MAATTTKAPSGTKGRVTVRPLHDKILVRRDEAREKTESGIYLPDTGKEKPRTGVVEAVGDGALNHETGERIPLTVKKGDRVIFSSYSGTEIKLGDQEFLMMAEDDVLAIID